MLTIGTILVGIATGCFIGIIKISEQLDRQINLLNAIVDHDSQA
jgi:hypothetical protein